MLSLNSSQQMIEWSTEKKKKRQKGIRFKLLYLIKLINSLQWIQQLL